MPCQLAYDAVLSVAQKMAGSQRAYRALDPDAKADLRQLAADLQAAGSTFESAYTAEKTRRDGFLYIIAHPRMDGVKVGRAFDPESRLNGYQTGCPNREYYLAYVGDYFEDCVTQEKRVHRLLHNVRLQGEWFDCPVEFAKDAIDSQSPFIAVIS